MSTTHRRVSRAPVYVTLVGLALAVLLVLIAARGSPAPPVAVEQPGTAAEPRVIAVIMRDYLFQPTPLVLVRGESVVFEIVNGGLEPHEFVLGDAGVQRAWASADAAATPPAPFTTPPPASVPPGVGGARVLLASGAAASVRFDVPAEGPLELICHLPGHAAQGMVGVVEVRDP